MRKTQLGTVTPFFFSKIPHPPLKMLPSMHFPPTKQLVIHTWRRFLYHLSAYIGTSTLSKNSTQTTSKGIALFYWPRSYKKRGHFTTCFASYCYIQSRSSLLLVPPIVYSPAMLYQAAFVDIASNTPLVSPHSPFTCSMFIHVLL